LTTAPDFRFGGRLALDLTWTVRFRAVAPTELLGTPADLDRWLLAAGFALHRGRSGAGDLGLARELRDAVDRSTRRRIDGQGPLAADVTTINEVARHAPPLPQLTADGGRTTAADGAPVRSALASVAHDAVDLLSSAPEGRLRVCEGELCSLLFLDDSRPGRRRWCSVDVCGNRTNTARYRARRSASD
jgi:predicted RNA-binding Zn ribbon-like protein